MTIKFKNQKDAIGEYFALENEKDVIDYIMYEHSQNTLELEEEIRATSNREEYSLKKSANIYATKIEINPAHNLDSFMKNKKNKFLEYVLKDLVILVNSKGGFQFLDNKNHEIIESEELLEMPSEETLFLKKGSTRLVLENDPYVDRFTIKYFQEKKEDFSFVTNLRIHSNSTLQEIYRDFQTHGGDTLFVYTTATDIEQMYNYTKEAVKAGIKKFEFIYAAGMNEKIDKFLKDFADQEIKIITPQETLPKKKKNIKNKIGL